MFFLENVCSACEVIKVLYFLKEIMNIICIIVPSLLIVFLTVDFFKNVLSGSEEESKKNTNLAIKRTIAAVCLFLVPTFIKITMNTLETAGVKGATYYSLATSEILKSDIFKDWEKSGDINYSAIIDFGSKSKIAASLASTSLTSKSPNGEFMSKKDFIVLAQTEAHQNGESNNYIRRETIKIIDKNNKELPPTNFTFKSENPAIAKVDSKGLVKANFGGTTNIIVTSKNNKSQSLKVKVTIVHSLYTKVKTRKKLTVTDLVTGKIVTLSKGTKGIYNGLAEKDPKRHYMSGNTLKVNNNYYKVDVDDVKHYDYQIDKKVDQKTAEVFVNDRGFKSKRKYLFWSNQGTQYEYIFKGTKGKWKLYKVFRISSGDALGYSIKEGNTHGNSGTGLYPTLYIMGSEVRTSYNSYSYPDGYIPKSSENRNAGGSGYHAYGGTRRPKTHGCTAFKKKDLEWFKENLSEIKGAQIVTI